MPLYGSGLVHSMNNPQFTYSLVIGPLGCFQFGNIMNRISIDIYIYVFVWICVFIFPGRSFVVEQYVNSLCLEGILTSCFLK